MTEPVQQTSQPPTQDGLQQTALDIILVVIETLLALLLRFDADLRQRAYPLVKHNTVVCVRSYVPHVTIYATFTVNGILLDKELNPNQTVDITINGFTWQIAQAIFSHKPSVIEQLQFRGEIEPVSLLKEFLLTIGVVKVVRTLVASVTGKKAKSEKPKTSIDEYKTRIKEQEQQIASLTIQQAEYTSTIAELKSQNKLLKISLVIVIVLLIISVIFF